ncbi:MAG: hypothetical protein ABI178_12040 [Rhodanobacter sp.]
MRERNTRSLLYLSASATFALLVFMAFARRFYLAPFFKGHDLPVLLHIHGAVMSGWVLLLAVQSGLIAARRVQWHRRLGTLGAAWAVLVVILGSVTTLHASAREVREHTGIAPLQLTITGLELVQMLLFAGFVTAAVVLRDRGAVHKRLMLLTIACMLPSVLPRLPLGLFQSITSILLAVDASILICIGFDTFWRRRLHPAFAVGGALIIATLQLAYFGANTPAWRNFLASVLS